MAYLEEWLNIMVDYKSKGNTSSSPKTLIEYGRALYYGLIDIDSELECYDIQRDDISDIDATELLIRTAELSCDYE